MLLVYTHKITPRVSYVFKHICTRVLGIPVKFTSKLEEFIAHEGAKLSYTSKKLGNELHIRSVDLLFEQGILAMDIAVQDWDGVPCFFQIKDATAQVPYDIFAATFYLLSRYEEYLPHVKDSLGRFPASESIAGVHDFLEQPVVDIWIQRFAEVLAMQFPNLAIQSTTYKAHMLVTVPQAFKYKKLGVLRAVGGYFKDFGKLRFREILKRTQVLLGTRKDPYDSFGWLANVQKQSAIPFQIFFQIGDYGQTAKNIKHSKRSFQSTIKMIGDYCSVGLLLSPQAATDRQVLAVERKRLQEIIHRPMRSMHVSDFKLNLPYVYRDALDQEIQSDYTMGYANTTGFRAGTSLSFLFYDLDYEIQTPLLIHPVCMQSDNVINYKNHTIDFVNLKELSDRIKTVNGVFRISFSNHSFDDIYSKKLFRHLITDE
ncbi:polysaccharide deacetylase family protein [uncultured Dokdonia sp.]|uniref:polysaccharide deacetylase family protein n=1 Tax=uncultured Dokdonia sp. TaxID=575653 RepID=UPI00262230ED|nr:polysaccharide deacetylase family protein [uncultured Dokdonia sp.]